MKSVWFSGLIAALMFCVISACVIPTEETGDQVPTPEAWFPMSEGSVWRYLCVKTDGDGATGETYSVSYTAGGTESIDGTSYTLITDDYGNTARYRLDDTVLYERSSDMPNAVAIADLSFAAGESRADTLAVTDNGETVTFIGTLTCLGTETVVTLIGSFPDCKVFELRGVDATTGNTLGIMTQWLDSDIGRVKFVEENYEDGVLVGTNTETVLHYNIVGGPSGGDTRRYDVSGRVVDPDGNGIAGFTVMYMGGGDNTHAIVTTEDGSYLFEDQPVGPCWVGIVVQPPDYWIAPDHYEIEIIAGDFTVDDFVGVRMSDPEGSNVSGTITTADGVVVNEVHITMTRMHGIWEEEAAYWQGYTLAMVPDGTYTITPSKDGYTFSPAEQTVTVAGANVTADFVAVGGYSLSGRLVTQAGIGIAGIVMQLRNSGHDSDTRIETESDSDGFFTFTNVPAGNYDVLYEDYEYSLEPPMSLVTVEDGDTTLPDIIVHPALAPYSISGTIRNSRGYGIINGPITLYDPVFGFEIPTWAENNGSFVFAMYNGTFTLTPDAAPYSVSPLSQQVTVDGASVTGVNFTFTAFTVSGRVVNDLGAALSGITMSLGGVGTATITTKTGADGRFAFTDILEGDYTVQPEVQGYTFERGMHWFQLRGGNMDIGTFTGKPESSGP
jgi:hypothetical protein